jgi:hypothetical protein
LEIPAADPAETRIDGTWVTHHFDTPIVLQHGTTYNLRFSTDEDTAYNMTAIREGRTFGYHPATYFSDGTAQETENGGQRWVAPYAWSNRNPEGDWQFYFTEAEVE